RSNAAPAAGPPGEAGRAAAAGRRGAASQTGGRKSGRLTACRTRSAGADRARARGPRSAPCAEGPERKRKACAVQLEYVLPRSLMLRSARSARLEAWAAMEIIAI